MGGSLFVVRGTLSSGHGDRFHWNSFDDHAHLQWRQNGCNGAERSTGGGCRGAEAAGARVHVDQGGTRNRSVMAGEVVQSGSKFDPMPLNGGGRDGMRGRGLTL